MITSVPTKRLHATQRQAGRLLGASAAHPIRTRDLARFVGQATAMFRGLRGARRYLLFIQQELGHAVRRWGWHGSLTLSTTGQTMIIEASISVWRSIIGTPYLLASTMPSGLKNCAFIWTAEKRNGAPLHPRATRRDRPNGLSYQGQRRGPRSSINVLPNDQRLIRAKKYHPKSHPMWNSTCACVERTTFRMQIACSNKGQSVRLTR
jgi:hypothetical protein